MSRWFVYIVRCHDDSLYTGITNDLMARLKKHNAGTGAKYTRSRLPVKLVWSEQKSSVGAARRREAKIKKMARVDKLSIIAHGMNRNRLFYRICFVIIGQVDNS
jgi:putative endonuclease